jgi:hypothetical protein
MGWVQRVWQSTGGLCSMRCGVLSGDPQLEPEPESVQDLQAIGVSTM